MKTLLIVLVSAVLFVSCETKSRQSFVGNWVEVMPSNPQIVQGVTLNGDGTASSIGMATLLYDKWSEKNGVIILYGKSIGNGQTIEFADTMDVIKISLDSMTLGKFETYRINYVKVADLQAYDPINIVDSLKTSPELGAVDERKFQGLLPAASCPGIEYTLLLYSQKNCGDGVYKLTQRYLEAENGKDVSYTTYGRQYTLRGDATDINATVLQLVPFNSDQLVNFLTVGDDLLMLNANFERAESPLNYTLKQIK